MADEKKVEVNNVEDEENMELDLDELENVSGGSIKNTKKKKTSSISKNTKSKV